MSPGQKTAAVVLTRGASTILIIFLLTTLVIFAVARIFDSSRMIHMNMEIALLFAHFLLLPSIHDKSEDACTLISIFIHFFFTACFVFMLLEAIHMYSLVAWVVRSDGLLSPLQNTVFGWTTAFTIGKIFLISSKINLEILISKNKKNAIGFNFTCFSAIQYVLWI